MRCDQQRRRDTRLGRMPLNPRSEGLGERSRCFEHDKMACTLSRREFGDPDHATQPDSSCSRRWMGTHRASLVDTGLGNGDRRVETGSDAVTVLSSVCRRVSSWIGRGSPHRRDLFEVVMAWSAWLSA